MHPIKILFIITSHASLGDGGEPTGVWFEEVAAPYYAFVDVGAEVVIVSPEGGSAPIDPRSLKPRGDNAPSVERFLDDSGAMARLKNTVRLTVSYSVNGFDAVFVPGGHGTMWDFPRNPVVSSAIERVWRKGGVVAAVCHGPAALVGPIDEAGKPLVAGRRVSAFTDSEERAVGLDKAVPFLLESELRDLGARFEGGPDFHPYAVADGRLITGQNPASSIRVAELTLTAVRHQQMEEVK